MATKTICVLLLSVSLFVLNAEAADLDTFFTLGRNSKSSVNGLEAFNSKKVEVSLKIAEQASKFGVDKERVLTKCELRLRQAGLEPVAENSAFLFVAIDARGPTCAVRLEFYQPVLFAGKEAVYSRRVATWATGQIGAHGGDPEFIMSILDQLLDLFLNEYLKANASQNK